MKTEFRTNVLATLCLSLILACGFSSAANAEDVLLNSSSVRATSADLRLIRTSMTPSKVELELPVQMAETVCAEYGTRVVYGQSGQHCGYDRLVRRVCVPDRVCHYNRRTNRTECQTVRRCYNEVVNVPRSCSWEEVYCVRREVQTSTETRSLTLKFKNMPTLSTGEQEVFELHGQQTHTDGQDANFSLTAASTRGPVKITARDGVFTGFKDVITIKGE